MPSARLGPKEPNAEGMDTPHITGNTPWPSRRGRGRSLWKPS